MTQPLPHQFKVHMTISVCQATHCCPYSDIPAHSIIVHNLIVPMGRVPVMLDLQGPDHWGHVAIALGRYSQ